MSNVYYVYIHTFLDGTKYVGKGKGKRSSSFSTRNTYWNRLRGKYGKPHVCIIKYNLSEVASLELEVMVIEILKIAQIPLCNITSGGEGSNGLTGEQAFWYGKARDIDTRRKISKSLSGENHPNYGIALSKTTRDKIGDKHRGKKVSKETCELLVRRGKERELTGSRNPAYSAEIHSFIHNTFGMISTTQYELYTTYGLSKSAVCCLVSGKRPSHKGWRLA